MHEPEREVIMLNRSPNRIRPGGQGRIWHCWVWNSHFSPPREIVRVLYQTKELVFPTEDRRSHLIPPLSAFSHMSAKHFGHVTSRPCVVHVANLGLISRGFAKHSADTAPSPRIFDAR